MKILVTGGCGFIGSNLVRHLLEELDEIEVVNLDLLTYAGNRANLEDLEDHPRYRFVHGDVCDGEAVRKAMRNADAVLNLAAETHVDRSISSGAPFVRTNVLGTQTLLTAAVAAGVDRFVQVSTDEVYGSAPEGTAFTESTLLAPSSPYSASKAAGDHLALAHHRTHGLDVVVVRASNNYGPFQYPEKLIPLMITNAAEGRSLPLYGDGLHVRDWLHVSDHCRGLVAALERGGAGELYNLGGRAERKNLDVVRAIVSEVGADPSLIRHVPDRPGHDRRYATDISKAREALGWEPRVAFADGLRETVHWYLAHPEWWRPGPSGAERGTEEGATGGAPGSPATESLS